MALFFHGIASLVIAECACASLIIIFCIDVPSLVCVDPRYLNWPTSSSVFSFISMVVDGWSWLDAEDDNFFLLSEQPFSLVDGYPKYLQKENVNDVEIRADTVHQRL